jgi:hypothetical protein
MAIRYAVATGNWSATSTWNGGTLPTSADDVYSNTFTVTIDTSPTVLSISNAATTGVTNGGSFIPTNGITLTATSTLNGQVQAGSLFNSTLGSGQSCTLVANISTPTFGNFTGNTTSNTSSGTLNITGSITGYVGGGQQFAVVNTSTGTINITGTITGATSYVVQNSSSGTIAVTGNVTGGGVASSSAILNNSTGTLNITGTIAGGTATLSHGVINNSTGTFTHVGTAQASNTAAAIGAGNVGQVTILSGPLLATTGTAGAAVASGANPCVALRWFPADNALTTFKYSMQGQTVSGSPSARPARDLYLSAAYDALYPTVANVRSGTAYGPGGASVGTCAVPAAASVVVGVAVDATVGTAAVTAASIRASLGLASANLDTQLSGLPASTATSVWAAGTRTLTTTIATASDIATAVWAVATSALTSAGTIGKLLVDRIDAAISSRLAPGGTLARVTLADTATTLTNAPTVPTAEEIAAEVRTELTPELTRVANCATVESTGDQIVALIP